MPQAVFVGIDAGSKTLKLVALDAAGDILFSSYHRHRSDVRTSLADMVHNAIWRHGDIEATIAMTGSAGIGLAEALGIPFAQEVIATTTAVKERYPDADCVIELGGEDAKITYLTGTPEQRMNATCAGGTGDFIDGIASMLGVKTRRLSKLAMGAQRTYPIASRCAVFAQTDVRPLINAGASKADIAQSALLAVVKQTLGGLACGRPIHGNVVLLGGPLEHIPALVLTFRKELGLDRAQCVKPPNAHLFAAMGAVLSVKDPPTMKLSDLERRIRELDLPRIDSHSLPPLFENAAEMDEFVQRHKPRRITRKRIDEASGPLFLGFDAGSTSMKYALIDETGALVASDYQPVEGDALVTAKCMLSTLLSRIESESSPTGRHSIAHATVTGYGEQLLSAAFAFDSSEVETVAHLRSAQHLHPHASFVLDIGGQDMKALWIRDGKVVDAVLNEACSSGCGAFVQSSAKSLRLSPEEFSLQALAAKHPIDLGAKCTVFMTSRVRYAQKIGASTQDIAAGIAYSVVNNALTRIIGKDRSSTLGDVAIVQGGAFESDAVLRAFEKTAGIRAIRPDNARLMGALGAALIARDRYENASLSVIPSETAQAPGSPQRPELGGFFGLRPQNDGIGNKGAFPYGEQPMESTFVTLDEISAIDPSSRTTTHCQGCENACLLTIIDFGDTRRFVSGNRCEKALPSSSSAEKPTAHGAINVVSLAQDLIASYRTVNTIGRRGHVKIGLMNTLNAYENTPFWHTLLSELGFSVVMPSKIRDARSRGRAAQAIPSESACMPAKLTHFRYESLVEAGASTVLMPHYERGTRCAVAALYARALKDSVEEPRLASPGLRSIKPRQIAMRADDKGALFEALGNLAGAANPITQDEFDHALEVAIGAQESFEQAILDATDRAFMWVKSSEERHLAVIASRPYHIDPALLHDIDRELARLGFAVVPTMGLHTEKRRKTLWKPAKRLVSLVERLAPDRQVEIIALRSFGCGYDAVSFDEARDVALSLHRPFTELKIDDISDIAHIRIRLRTLAYTSRTLRPSALPGRETQRGGQAGKTMPSCDESMPKPRKESANARGAFAAHEAPGMRTELREFAVPTPDLCSTVKRITELAIAQCQSEASPKRIRVPQSCISCLNDAVAFELRHLGFDPSGIEETPMVSTATTSKEGKLKVGLVGNPVLVFDPVLNEGVAHLLEKLGCQVIYPDPNLVYAEDARFLEQLNAFKDAGVDRVIYLQSFGCLKGHVQSRGAARELARRFPDMPITIIDYDSESSALNRENRIRLAIS